MLHVIRAEYTSDYRAHLWFNDGTDGEVDLASSLEGPIFEPLQNVAYFKTFKIEGHTLSWENGADFAPEYLYELMQSATPA
jgi:hypothetical protein